MLLSEHQVIEHQRGFRRFNRAIFSDISFGFMPAFKNLNNDQVHLSRDNQGELSLMHLFDGLPECWIKEKDEQGAALTLKIEIIAGFLRNAEFYTLNEIVNDIKDS